MKSTAGLELRCETRAYLRDARAQGKRTASRSARFGWNPDGTQPYRRADSGNRRPPAVRARGPKKTAPRLPQVRRRQVVCSGRGTGVNRETLAMIIRLV